MIRQYGSTATGYLPAVRLNLSRPRDLHDHTFTMMLVVAPGVLGGSVLDLPMQRSERARSYKTENGASPTWVVHVHVTRSSSYLAIDMSSSDQAHRRWPRLRILPGEITRS